MTAPLAVYFNDQRPEAAAQLKMQELADESLQVKQLKVQQEMANESPQVKHLDTIQLMANEHASSQALQKMDRKTTSKTAFQTLRIPAQTVQLKLSKETLNVVGENHAESAPFRTIETNIAKVDAGGELWLENQFKLGGEQEQPFGDSPELLLHFALISLVEHMHSVKSNDLLTEITDWQLNFRESEKILEEVEGVIADLFDIGAPSEAQVDVDVSDTPDAEREAAEQEAEAMLKVLLNQSGEGGASSDTGGQNAELDSLINEIMEGATPDTETRLSELEFNLDDLVNESPIDQMTKALKYLLTEISEAKLSVSKIMETPQMELQALTVHALTIFETNIAEIESKANELQELIGGNSESLEVSETDAAAIKALWIELDTLIAALVPEKLWSGDKKDDVNEERSKHMHQAAEDSLSTKGIWKIGESHVEDIKNEKLEPSYNLMPKTEFMGMYRERFINEESEAGASEAGAPEN